MRHDLPRECERNTLDRHIVHSSMESVEFFVAPYRFSVTGCHA